MGSVEFGGPYPGNGTIIPYIWEDQTIADGGIIFVVFANIVWMFVAGFFFHMLRRRASRVSLPLLHALADEQATDWEWVEDQPEGADSSGKRRSGGEALCDSDERTSEHGEIGEHEVVEGERLEEDEADPETAKGMVDESAAEDLEPEEEVRSHAAVAEDSGEVGQKKQEIMVADKAPVLGAGKQERLELPPLFRRIEEALGREIFSMGPLQADEELHLMRSPFGWLWAPYRYPPSAVRALFGVNAYIYLAFEWIALVFCLVLAFFSLTIMMPINISGGELDRHAYAVTTISNIPVASNLYWGHVAMTGWFFLLTMCFAAVFVYVVVRERWNDVEQKRPVVRISGIPDTLEEGTILSELRDAFGSHELVKFELVRDLSRYERLARQLSFMTERLEHFRSMKDLARTTVHTGFWFLGRKQPAVAYYTDRVEDLEVQLANCEPGRMPSLGIGFLTLRSVRSAEIFANTMKGIRGNKDDVKFPPLDLMFSRQLRISSWKVRQEVVGPRDVIWMNMGLPRSNRWLRRVLVFVTILAYLWFFTSPSSVIASLKQLLSSARVIPHENHFAWLPLHGLLFAYVPTVFLLFVGLPLPEGLKALARLEGWTSKARMAASVVQKAFVFTFFGFVFFPSVQSISMDLLIEQLLNTNLSVWDRLGHTFLADSGAFFINYVIQLSMFGVIMAVVPLGKLIEYAAVRFYYTHIKTVTEEERQRSYLRVQKKFSYPFSYGTNLVVIGLTVIYGSSVPLLPVAAALYFFTRSIVDRFLIFYVDPQLDPVDGKLVPFSRDNFDIRLVQCVLAFLLACLVFQQLMFFSFYSVRRYSSMMIVHTILLLIASGLCVLIPAVPHAVHKARCKMGLARAVSEAEPPLTDEQESYSWLADVNRRYRATNEEHAQEQ